MDQASHLPPVSDGPTVLVRNTFLEFEENKPRLRRAITEPGRGAAPVEDDESEDDDAEGEDPTDEGGLDAMPGPPALERNVTQDWFERRDEWSWTDRLPGPPPLNLGGDSPVAPLAAVAMQPQQPPLYVMVPLMLPVGPDISTQVCEPDRGRWLPPPPVAPAPAVFHDVAVPADVPLPPPPERVASVTPAAAVVGDNAEANAGSAAAADSVAAGAVDAAEALEGSARPRADEGLVAPPLSRVFSVRSGFFRVNWTVASRLLKAKDTKAVSPPFGMSLGSRLPVINFKIMLQSIETQASRGGASFKKSKGRGRVMMRCEALTPLPDDEATLSFRISIGSQGNMSEPRGPVTHNFAANATAGLPEDEEVWDFTEAVDEAIGKFCVCVEFVPSRRSDEASTLDS